MTDKCEAIGFLMVGGKRVGLLRCGETAGHDGPVAVIKGDTLPELRVPMAYALEGNEVILREEPGSPHRAILTWEDADVVGEDWPEAYDPEEGFDTEVGLELPADYGLDV